MFGRVNSYRDAALPFAYVVILHCTHNALVLGKMTAGATHRYRTTSSGTSARRIMSIVMLPTGSSRIRVWPQILMTIVRCPGQRSRSRVEDDEEETLTVLLHRARQVGVTESPSAAWAPVAITRSDCATAVA